MSKQAYKFRLYPTRKQAQALQWTLDRARELYNASLQERRDAYRMAGKSITYYDQANQLPEMKQVREEYQDIHSQVLQDVLRRLNDLTYSTVGLDRSEQWLVEDLVKVRLPLDEGKLGREAIDPPKAAGGSSGSGTLGSTFGGALPNAARIVALRPMLDRAYESVDVHAITASGADVPLLRLHGPRPQWFQRYWLQEPVELASGSKITVRVTPLSDYSDEPAVTRRLPLQVVLDYIPL